MTFTLPSTAICPGGNSNKNQIFFKPTPPAAAPKPGSLEVLVLQSKQIPKGVSHLLNI
ncbi:hypothetical protein DDB_G0278837 [Dictyostelium discoideum AX4]|uniref:Uncharacterized protein n=1 Tax=Dictyostelium discoideum TaxID=44689 RepID=Q54XN2_DICDI|nr:hypothetical protein DDB_G0278837 [Dictyostelium discoideum AX4]EAL68020.1 hypothetical protein DDB_G0278837 [Dictyostelium discoideum AX4]|eukprot:XP_641998.1 hypothetical protein DDB_G0278837 [Dictyostelium discoideum AX4]